MKTRKPSVPISSLLIELTPGQVEELVWEEIIRQPELLYYANDADHPDLKNYPLLRNFIKQELRIQLEKIDGWAWSGLNKFVKELQNTQILYATDIYDISEYCFPFGIPGDIRSTPPAGGIDYLIDRQLAWQHLFSDDIILFDQYKPELRYLKRSAGRKFPAEAVAEYQKLTPLLQQSQEEKSQAVNDLEQNLKLYLGTFFGFAQSGMDRLRNLLSDCLIVDEDMFSEKSYRYPDVLVEELMRNQPGVLAYELYQERGQTFKGDSEMIAHRRANLYTDCAVLDRLININKGLENLSGVQQRFIVLFVSSTQLFDDYFTKHPTYRYSLPKGPLGRPIELLRNVQQLYARILVEQSRPVEKPLERLNDFLFIRQIVQTREQAKVSVTANQEEANYPASKDSKSLVSFRQQTQDLRKAYEGYARLTDYDRYEQRFKEEFKQFKVFLDGAGLSQLVDEVSQAVSSYELENDIKASQTRLNGFVIGYNFQEQLEASLSRLDQATPFISTSPHDYIGGTDHHLPTLLTVRQPASQSVLDSLIQVIFKPDFVRAKKEPINELDQHQRDELRRQLAKMQLRFSTPPIAKSDPNALTDFFDDNIVKYLLFLILPPIYPDQDRERIMQWSLRSDIRQLTELVLPSIPEESAQRSKETLQNLRYIEIWVLRRLGYFGKSLELVEIANQTDQEFFGGHDPRFYHGASLATYCLYCQKKEETQQSDLQLLQDAIKSSEKAYDHFEKSAQSADVYEQKGQIVKKTFLALVNSLIYLKTVLFGHTYKQNSANTNQLLIDELRKKLDDELKSGLNKAGASVDQYPEYMHTEAHLEFWEATLACEQENYELALKKTNMARQTLMKAQAMHKQRSPLANQQTERSSELFRQLMEQLNELEKQLPKTNSSAVNINQ